MILTFVYVYLSYILDFIFHFISFIYIRILLLIWKRSMFVTSGRIFGVRNMLPGSNA